MGYRFRFVATNENFSKLGGGRSLLSFCAPPPPDSSRNIQLMARTAMVRAFFMGGEAVCLPLRHPPSLACQPDTCSGERTTALLAKQVIEC